MKEMVDMDASTRIYGSPTLLEVMDWIFEIEMMFESCECSNKQKTVLTVR